MIVFLLVFLTNCHPASAPIVLKLPVKPEFQKMAWLAGIWSDPDDSIRTYYLWRRENDSLLSGSSWQIKGKDSLALEIDEISVSNDDILLTQEIFGKNDGTPNEYKLITNKNGIHVFESSGSDFPQRIIFRLNPDGSLYTRLEGTTDGQARYQEKVLSKIR